MGISKLWSGTGSKKKRRRKTPDVRGTWRKSSDRGKKSGQKWGMKYKRAKEKAGRAWRTPAA